MICALSPPACSKTASLSINGIRHQMKTWPLGLPTTATLWTFIFLKPYIHIYMNDCISDQTLTTLWGF